MNNIISHLEYFSKLSNTEKFKSILIILVLYVLSRFLPVINTVYILIFILIIFYFNNQNDTTDRIVSTGNKINIVYSKKLDDIISYTRIKDKVYLHNDIDIVRILDTLKYNFTNGKTNHTTFKNIVYSLNSFLKIKDTINTAVCSGVKPPELLKNWDNQIPEINYSFEINCSSKKRVENIKELFEEAFKQAKLCLNYTHGLIVNTQSHLVKHAVHEETYNRMKLLIYRHMDEIYNQVKKQKSISKADLDIVTFDFKIFNRSDNDLFDNSVNNSFKFEL